MTVAERKASRIGARARGRRGFWPRRLSRGTGLGSFFQAFGKDVAVAGGEGDAAEGGEGGDDVGGRDGLEVLAGLNAEAHQQNGNVLIVVVW